MAENRYLAHSAKGTTWNKRDHKYTSKTTVNGKVKYTYLDGVRRMAEDGTGEKINDFYDTITYIDKTDMYWADIDQLSIGSTDFNRLEKMGYAYITKGVNPLQYRSIPISYKQMFAATLASNIYAHNKNRKEKC